MSLEIGGKYETVGGNKVHILSVLPHDRMTFAYSYELSKILGIEDIPFEELMNVLQDETVFCGLTDDTLMPGGDWHGKTGKCLSGNVGGSISGKKYQEKLERFNIETKE